MERWMDDGANAMLYALVTSDFFFSFFASGREKMLISIFLSTSFIFSLFHFPSWLSSDLLNIHLIRKVR